MWSIGSIIGAAMGGYLAQPSRYYPALFPANGLFGQYPYLLPNLVAVGFIFLAIVQGYFFLKETNPRFKSQLQQAPYDSEITGPVDERTPLQPGARRGSVMEVIGTGTRRPSFISGSMPTMSEPSFNLRRGSVTILHEIHDIKPATSEIEHVTRGDQDDHTQHHVKAFNRSVIMWIVAVVILCYHQMAFASLLPIFFSTSQKTFVPST